MEMGDLHDACERVVNWLTDRLITSARGDHENRLDVEPSGRFWLGRLAPEAAVINAPYGDRSERMEPCAIGLRLRPVGEPPWHFSVSVMGCAWQRRREGDRNVWRKTELAEGTVRVVVPSNDTNGLSYAVRDFDRMIRDLLGVDVLRMCVRIDLERGRDGSPELVVSAVNESPETSTQLADTAIYQARLRVTGLVTLPFLLEALPDSFRYDRRVSAFGINCGVATTEAGDYESTDVVTVDLPRLTYWALDEKPPDLAFAALSQDTLPSLHQLVAAHRSWGDAVWSPAALDRRMRSEGWSPSMRAQADRGAAEFEEEARRLKDGLRLLESSDHVLRSFKLMNEAMMLASRGAYMGWRHFQVGFILANLASILGQADEMSTADILWFSTGGGKTETYLGLLIMAAFHDRLSGKVTGITAWSRFPLRLLSLQQTQRFANAIAAAELVRRKHVIAGDPFSLGFFVGDTSTPNSLKNDPSPSEPDPDDDSMPSRFQVLLRCPFCDSAIDMPPFNRRLWRLEHHCTNSECPWPEDALPIYVVDEEIYRYLPTIVVGTLDKVANVAMQAAMRGFIGPPQGLCTESGHGFAYSPRQKRPNGCLVPGCRGAQAPLPMPGNRFPPSFRLQDELHLLRDSLGAIDAHYESLLDHLTTVICDAGSKIVASSATLTGYERQCDVLYCRKGRAFPAQGPSTKESFWSAPTPHLLRRYASLAPRGATLEFAADRILTELQRAVRELQQPAGALYADLGIDAAAREHLVSAYGTNVVYGNTIRDLDASVRSLETQVPVTPLHTAMLTGHTPFNEVRSILERLQHPEDNFDDRVHVVAASSMMSHGVDVDRLNSMVMLGVPLATAEFIQATARIGRTWPGIIFVLHKMSLERDASVHRSFRAFVEQGDRFIEAIPVTRRSRRVLERTLPGLIMARLLHVHEPMSRWPLTTILRARDFLRARGIDAQTELRAIDEMLQLEPTLDEGLREQAERMLTDFFRRMNDPATTEKFPNKLFPTGIMRSLRDVEDQAPIHD
jgi:hypothetical protein